ncbi:P-loop containing nucleoside triphosphate hydrolase protein [Podospora appendiculata]|uniref:P-loop containing nucleoside triphosphate hydrolase protein n=1 Tax=Podospora appendiculata TaxID=314037 RepID=A0AAE0X7B4_9PEZI|nr:P-loop containing nucleoside triphosphate hydrolase protein [Podospora appendiculata]
MGSIRPEASSFDGLGNHVYLEKQDKLRDIGVDIHTSQIVVVGGQSSGKSSLLESLTGFSFPRGQGLCTRYATQITLRRNPVKSTIISITPRSNADPALTERLRGFHRELEDFDGKTLASIIEEANTVMGIRSGPTKDDSSLPMFSDDILKIEISGPEKPHLTVIDVPGLFQVTDGVTTDLDKQMVENMARRYMENERTLVLAVLTCLADPATEGVLQFAKAADPNGERTVGVLTKADVVSEQAVFRKLTEQVQSTSLKFGYFVVRNRGADEDDLDLAECKSKESLLFAKPQWADIAELGRAGVEALRTELQVLLTDLAKRELPKQRSEVEQRLRNCRAKRDAMGPARSGPASQREYLINLASKFEQIVRDALEGRYEGDPIFNDLRMRLITKIVNLNEGYSNLVAKKGHIQCFVGSHTNPETAITFKYEKDVKDALKSGSSIQDLSGIVDHSEMVYDGPKNSIIDFIEKCYNTSRGLELGTFNGGLLSICFRKQASKWSEITESHIKSTIAIIHGFITTLLEHVFVDQRVREELWQIALVDKLQSAYRQAMMQAKGIINIELNGRPSTYNHYFSDNLQKARLQRLETAINTASSLVHDSRGNLIADKVQLNPKEVTKLVVNKSNAEQATEDMHDILKSYYQVARKRFVDTICRHVIEYFLLDSTESPLKVLTPGLIVQMDDSQLDRIAGEDAATRRERQRLKLEIQGLEAAMKVLRS